MRHTNKAVDFIKKEHIGKWVALSKNRKGVVAYSNNLKDLQQKVGKNVVYIRPLPTDTVFAF